jgi:hypothetical protein
MLENPHYIGMVKWNERKSVLVVDNGEFRKTRPKTPKDEYILCEGKHEAIISKELFDAAQEKRGRTHRTCDNKELKNPFASLLRCECGRSMSYRHSTRGNLKYRREPRLVCNNQKYCGNGSCSIPEIMDFVVDLLRNKIEEFEFEIKSGNEDSYKAQEKILKNLETKLANNHAKELSLWESQVDPDPNKRMPQHIFQALTDKLLTERKEIEIALEKTRKTVSTPIYYETKLVTFQKTLDALLDDEVSVSEKNNLLKSCIESITYHREKPHRVLGKGSGRQWTTPPIEIDIKLNI